jgi:APA family basic amino acid/polyamine antiporter
MPDAERTFRAPLCPVVPIAAIIGCIILAFYLNLNAIIITCFFIAIGLLVYHMKRRTRQT